MKRIFVVAVLWAWALVAAAAGPAAVRKQVEMSMLVTGTIDIGPDGGVRAHVLDGREALPPVVATLIDGALPQWRFEPQQIDGKPIIARTKMSLRIVAKRQVDDSYIVGIRGYSFGESGGVPGETVTSDHLPPPAYPEVAYRSGIKGTVYLLLRIGRDGKVEEAVAEQVNLTVVGDERQMRLGRDALSRAALNKAKSWLFNPPTKGKAADAPVWSVRVPVSFRYTDEKLAANGEWEAYVPGPHTKPWWVDDDSALGSPDAMVAGGVYQVGNGPRLLTPPGES
jgi:TonB family protein